MGTPFSSPQSACLVLAFAASVFATPAAAELRVPATVLRVIDGDTLHVEAKIWVRQTVRVNVRVLHMDSPEIGGAKCAAERRRGEAARDYAKQLVGKRGKVLLTGVKDDKFGKRVGANVKLADGRDFARIMIDTGHGRPYKGRRRKPWCP